MCEDGGAGIEKDNFTPFSQSESSFSDEHESVARKCHARHKRAAD